jgi:hypothetical protein
VRGRQIKTFNVFILDYFLFLHWFAELSDTKKYYNIRNRKKVDI